MYKKITTLSCELSRQLQSLIGKDDLIHLRSSFVLYLESTFDEFDTKIDGNQTTVYVNISKPKNIVRITLFFPSLTLTKVRASGRPV